MNTISAKGRGFHRWAAIAGKKRALTLEYAVTAIVVQLEEAGFSWLDNSFDAGSVPAHAINLERMVSLDRVDFVQVVFDKRQRARFQILFGSKEKAPPHRWICSAALVWKKKSESVDYKWWGARWWQMDHEKALWDAVDSASSRLPQVLQYLSEGVTGANIWPADLGSGAANLRIAVAGAPRG